VDVVAVDRHFLRIDKLIHHLFAGHGVGTAVGRRDSKHGLVGILGPLRVVTDSGEIACSSLRPVACDLGIVLAASRLALRSAEWSSSTVATNNGSLAARVLSCLLLLVVVVVASVSIETLTVALILTFTWLAISSQALTLDREVVVLGWLRLWLLVRERVLL